MTTFVHFYFPTSEVVFVYLFIDCGVVTVAFAFISDLFHPCGFSFLHFHQFFLELFSLLIDFLHTLRYQLRYLEKLSIFHFLNSKFLFQILNFFFKCIKINFKLLLNANMLPNFSL